MNTDSIEKIIERDKQLTSILNNIDLGLLLQGPNAEIFMSNEIAFELLGLTKDQLMGRTSFDPEWNVVKEDNTPFPNSEHPVPQAIATKRTFKNVIMGVYRPIHKDRVWLSVDAIPILNDDGSIKYVVCSFFDISEEKHAKDELNKRHNELSILYNVYKNTTENLDLKVLFSNALSTLREAFSIDGITIYTIKDDSDLLIYGSSEGFSEDTVKEIQSVKRGEGLSGRSIISGIPHVSNYNEYPESRFRPLFLNQGFKSMYEIPMMIGPNAVGAMFLAFKRENAIESAELQLLMAVGRQLGITIQNAQLLDTLRNELKERFRIEEEILEANKTINHKNQLLNQVMAKLEIESKIDPLTGLYNRRYMLQRITDEIDKFNSDHMKFSIIIADIDNFKSMNDTYGHDYGDYILKCVSDIIKSNIREIDCLSRWGGDEFLILLSETDSNASYEIMERIRKTVNEKAIKNEKHLILTMTFGISEFTGEESIDDIIKKADDALYVGKKRGRNCVVTYDQKE